MDDNIYWWISFSFILGSERAVYINLCVVMYSIWSKGILFIIYEITGKKKGKANIKVVLASGKTAVCKITVK